MRRRVLILCTHNSARSQVAEAFLRALAGDRFEVASAGTEATQVHPIAIQAMDEIGVNIRTHVSKTLDGFLEERLAAFRGVRDEISTKLRTRVNAGGPLPGA